MKTDFRRLDCSTGCCLDKVRHLADQVFHEQDDLINFVPREISQILQINRKECVFNLDMYKFMEGFFGLDKQQHINEKEKRHVVEIDVYSKTKKEVCTKSVNKIFNLYHDNISKIYSIRTKVKQCLYSYQSHLFITTKNGKDYRKVMKNVFQNKLYDVCEYYEKSDKESTKNQMLIEMRNLINTQKIAYSRMMYLAQSKKRDMKKIAYYDEKEQKNSTLWAILITEFMNSIGITKIYENMELAYIKDLEAALNYKQTVLTWAVETIDKKIPDNFKDHKCDETILNNSHKFTLCKKFAMWNSLYSGILTAIGLQSNILKVCGFSNNAVWDRRILTYKIDYLLVDMISFTYAINISFMDNPSTISRMIYFLYRVLNTDHKEEASKLLGEAGAELTRALTGKFMQNRRRMKLR